MDQKETAAAASFFIFNAIPCPVQDHIFMSRGVAVIEKTKIHKFAEEILLIYSAFGTDFTVSEFDFPAT